MKHRCSQYRQEIEPGDDQEHDDHDADTQVDLQLGFGESLDGLADAGDQVAPPQTEEASQAADLGELADDIVDEDLLESLALDLMS